MQPTQQDREEALSCWQDGDCVLETTVHAVAEKIAGFRELLDGVKEFFGQPIFRKGGWVRARQLAEIVEQIEGSETKEAEASTGACLKLEIENVRLQIENSKLRAECIDLAGDTNFAQAAVLGKALFGLDYWIIKDNFGKFKGAYI